MHICIPYTCILHQLQRHYSYRQTKVLQIWRNTTKTVSEAQESPKAQRGSPKPELKVIFMPEDDTFKLLSLAYLILVSAVVLETPTMEFLVFLTAFMLRGLNLPCITVQLCICFHLLLLFFLILTLIFLTQVIAQLTAPIHLSQPVQHNITA